MVSRKAPGIRLRRAARDVTSPRASPGRLRGLRLGAGEERRREPTTVLDLEAGKVSEAQRRTIRTASGDPGRQDRRPRGRLARGPKPRRQLDEIPGLEVQADWPFVAYFAAKSPRRRGNSVVYWLVMLTMVCRGSGPVGANDKFEFGRSPVRVLPQTLDERRSVCVALFGSG